VKIETERLVITELSMDMAESVYINSQDEDNRIFVPDEVFETLEAAEKTVAYLITCHIPGTGHLYMRFC
jgi:hypothetical protein